MHEMACELHAQLGCAQTISANVLLSQWWVSDLLVDEALLFNGQQKFITIGV